MSDPKGAVLVHLGSSNFLERFQVYVAHVQEWRSQFARLDSVDLRYEGQVIVNPDSTAARAKQTGSTPQMARDPSDRRLRRRSEKAHATRRRQRSTDTTMGSQTENLLTVIDVGSAKTCVIVAEVNEYALRYRGHGIADSRGMRKGVIADLDKAVDSIKKAVEEAENVAQAPGRARHRRRRRFAHSRRQQPRRHLAGLAHRARSAATTFAPRSRRRAPFLCPKIASRCTCCRRSSSSTTSPACTIRPD